VKYIEILTLNNHSGIYNITSSLSLSRIDMLKYVLNIYTTRKNYSGCIIEKKLHDFSTAKYLPLNTTLSVSKIIEVTGHVPLTFHEATEKILNYNLVK
jgi:dTDP-4-dehydrorhamnose reductase